MRFKITDQPLEVNTFRLFCKKMLVNPNIKKHLTLWLCSVLHAAVSVLQMSGIFQTKSRHFEILLAKPCVQKVARENKQELLQIFKCVAMLHLCNSVKV